MLERRLLLWASAESEPNDTPAAADAVTTSASPHTVSGTMTGGSDTDFFTFTLHARSGVYLDIDSRDIGLSETLDTVLEVYDSPAADTPIGINDDGRDFDAIALNDTAHTELPFGDAALYLDLAPGTYLVKLYAYPDTSGAYELKFTADDRYATAAPDLSGLPGAPDTLFLDFDGHAATDAWNGGQPYAIEAFDLNGNAGEWTPAEQRAAENVWRVVADAFAPFNINVTTRYSGAYTTAASAFRIVVGNSDGSEVGAPADGPRGLAARDSYSSVGASSKTGFVFADNIEDYPEAGVSGDVVARAITIGNTAVHQFGHALGLAHYGGTNPQLNGFMQSPPVGLNRQRWVSGTTHSDESPVVAQDDLAVITKAANTITYRADDHGNTRQSATVLAAAGNAYAAGGVVHQTGDVDYFRFAGAGATTITLDIPEHLGRLDGEVVLYNGSGQQLRSSDVADQLGGAIALTLPASGNYFVAVRSDGGPGEIGQYALRINTTLATTGSIGGRVFRDIGFNNVYEPTAGDTFLGNVRVFLDANNNGVRDTGETSTTSSAVDGTYAFTALPNATYTVRQEVPAGYASNVAHEVVVNGGASADVQFGNFPTTFTGGTGGDAYTVRRASVDASRVEIVDATTARTCSAPLWLVPSLSFATGGGDDVLTVDYAKGDPVPAAGIALDGGANAAGTAGDRLVVLGSASDDNYTVAGATVTSGGRSIAHALVENVVFNSGDGNDTLTISAAPAAAVTFNGGTNAAFEDTLNVDAGAHTFAADARDGTANLTVNVRGASAAVVFAATQHLRALNVAAGTATLLQNGARLLVTDTLSVTNGKLDLSDNGLLVHAGVLGTSSGGAYTGIQGRVASGYNGGAWDGNGIRTGTPDAATGLTSLASATAAHVLGIASNASGNWQGEPVAGSAVIVKYTFGGDTNLDGKLDADDYGTIDFSVLLPEPVDGYFNGDFNYDGKVDADDYGVIDFNILV